MFSVLMWVIPACFIGVTLRKSFDCDAGILQIACSIPDLIVLWRVACLLGSVLEVFFTL